MDYPELPKSPTVFGESEGIFIPELKIYSEKSNLDGANNSNLGQFFLGVKGFTPFDTRDSIEATVMLEQPVLLVEKGPGEYPAVKPIDHANYYSKNVELLELYPEYGLKKTGTKFYEEKEYDTYNFKRAIALGLLLDNPFNIDKEYPHARLILKNKASLDSYKDISNDRGAITKGIGAEFNYAYEKLSIKSKLMQSPLGAEYYIPVFEHFARTPEEVKAIAPKLSENLLLA